MQKHSKGEGFVSKLGGNVEYDNSAFLI